MAAAQPPWGPAVESAMAALVTAIQPVFGPLAERTGGPAAIAIFTVAAMLFAHAAMGAILGAAVGHIPGPMGFPFVGHIPYLVHSPWLAFHRFAMKYGRVYKIWLWNKLFVVIADPETVKYIFQDARKNFPKDDWSYDYFRDILGYGLVTVEGSTWLAHKQILSPAFQFGALERLHAVFVGAADRFAANVEAAIDGRDAGPSVGGPPASAHAGPALSTPGKGRANAELSGCFRHVTLEVISEIALGLGPAKAGVFPLLFETILEELNQRPFGPWRKFLPWLEWPYSRKLASLNDIVFGMIKERRALRVGTSAVAAVSKGGDEAAMADSSGAGAGVSLSGKAIFSGGTDMLDMLLDCGVALTDREIADELKTQLLAGHETTSMMLTWTCYLLAAHPAAMAKAVEEVDRAVGDGSGATFETYKGLRYLESAMKEALRLYSPVPVLTRVSVAADSVPVSTGPQRYAVPAGTGVMVSIWSLHKNAELWGADVEEFRPERFSPEETAKRHPWAFIPFSAGPRVCIGQNLSLSEGRVVLATLLRKFTLTLAPGQGKPTTDCYIMPVRPAEGLHIVLTRRK